MQKAQVQFPDWDSHRLFLFPLPKKWENLSHASHMHRERNDHYTTETAMHHVLKSKQKQRV